MKLIQPLVNKQILCVILAMAFSQLFVIIYPLKQGFWIPLTAFVVCLTINSSIAAFRRGFHRILGTILGVIAGGILTNWVISINFLLGAIIIFASIAYWSKCYQKLYSVFVFFITIVVVLLLDIFWHDNKIVFHSMMSTRVIDTIIGSIIAYFFALLILPHHQHSDILKSMKKSLLKIYLTYSNDVSALINNKKTKSFEFIEPFYEVNSFINDNIPIWSYDLLLDRYIYSRFILFIHRIHKIIIILKLLDINLAKVGIINNNEIIDLLLKNKKTFNILMKNFINMKKDEAILAINELNQINEKLIVHVFEQNNDALIQVAILLKEIENDLHAIVYGVSYFYLYDKSNKLN